MTSRAIKRIMKEKIAYYKNRLDNEGIYIHFDENDVMVAKVLIVGSNDTPYENGFYFFKFTFSDQYPHKPPKCIFFTTKGKMKMNPNLYTDGYVCLSLLGTWTGPSWTSCNTLTSICVSLQALVLNKNPIRNEPIYSNITGEPVKRYNRIITYKNLTTGVLEMINNTPKGFECFESIILQKFKNNFQWYMDIIEKNKHLTGETDIDPIYSRKKITYDYIELKEYFIQLAVNLGIDVSAFVQDEDDTPVDNTPVDNTPVDKNDVHKEAQNIKTTSKYKRQAPNGKAIHFEVGFKKISENNGKQYFISLGKNGNKYWKKVK